MDTIKGFEEEEEEESTDKKEGYEMQEYPPLKSLI
jgi:hypothetical protein